MVLASIWLPFWTPKPLKRTPQDTQIVLCGISKYPNLKLIIEFFHLLIIPMTLFNHIMPNFDELIHVYGWNMSILSSPLKIWTPQNFTTANFRHPVSKSWLRHWCKGLIMCAGWGLSQDFENACPKQQFQRNFIQIFACPRIFQETACPRTGWTGPGHVLGLCSLRAVVEISDLTSRSARFNPFMPCGILKRTELFLATLFTRVFFRKYFKDTCW